MSERDKIIRNLQKAGMRMCDPTIPQDELTRLRAIESAARDVLGGFLITGGVVPCDEHAKNALVPMEKMIDLREALRTALGNGEKV